MMMMMMMMMMMWMCFLGDDSCRKGGVHIGYIYIHTRIELTLRRDKMRVKIQTTKGKASPASKEQFPKIHWMVRTVESIHELFRDDHFPWHK